MYVKCEECSRCQQCDYLYQGSVEANNCEDFVEKDIREQKLLSKAQRVRLHIVSLVTSGHLMWHFRGILREII